VVTAKIQKKYTEISYSLEDSDDANKSEEESEEEGSNEVVVQGRTGTSVIKSSRLRSKAETQQDKLNEAEERKDHQMTLYKEKQKDHKIRFNKGEIAVSTKKDKVKQMDLLNAYKDPSAYPKDLIPGQIYVDMKKSAILIPNTPQTFIPLHVSTVKSVSDNI
jgi:nucleosome binding factor SPN SPT16 subunit